MTKITAFFMGVFLTIIVFMILILYVVPSNDTFRVVKIGDRIFVKAQSKFGTVIGFDGKAPILRLDSDRVFTTEVLEKQK
jgi:hypothetical protein